MWIERSAHFLCNFQMRIRRKKWVRSELSNCSFFIDNPTENIGFWHNKFKKLQPIHLELGCGKGSFISKLASKNQDINFIAVDIKSEMLGLAKRNIESAYKDANLSIDNILLAAHDINRISMIFNSCDIVDRIYINFCNPWPRKKHKKRRLTHLRQLTQYRSFLKKGGEIFFKTDDDELFSESIDYFKESNFSLVYLTYDLENSGFSDNIETEHEKMFKNQGLKIKFLIAKKLD